MDYVYNQSSLLMIETCQKRKCITIFIVNNVNNDNIADATMETFNVTLDRSENVPLAVSIDPAEAVVQISKESKYLY